MENQFHKVSKRIPDWCANDVEHSSGIWFRRRHNLVVWQSFRYFQKMQTDSEIHTKNLRTCGQKLDNLIKQSRHFHSLFLGRESWWLVLIKRAMEKKCWKCLAFMNRHLHRIGLCENPTFLYLSILISQPCIVLFRRCIIVFLTVLTNFLSIFAPILPANLTRT